LTEDMLLMLSGFCTAAVGPPAYVKVPVLMASCGVVGTGDEDMLLMLSGFCMAAVGPPAYVKVPVLVANCGVARTGEGFRARGPPTAP